MISLLCLLLGISISLNVCLIFFLIFVFRSKKLQDLIYDKFEEKVEVIEESQDLFSNLR